MIEKRRWPWLGQQNWKDVLFIHTPFMHHVLRPFVPKPFEIDMYDGRSWVSIVLFKATHSRLRYMPSPVSYPPFYQMNIRTYVKFGSEPGVYFFSINTNSELVNCGGRFVSLPFQNANINIQQSQDTFYFEVNRRTNSNNNMLFKAAYEPLLASITPRADTLPHFLTERYCIWMIQGKRIVKAPIFHSHWNLHDVKLSIKECKGLPFSFSEDTIAHYNAFKHAVIHPFETFGKVSK